MRDAVLALFDGRGYAIEQSGSKTLVAGGLWIEAGEDDLYTVNVWVPTSALGQDGYPAN